MWLAPRSVLGCSTGPGLLLLSLPDSHSVSRLQALDSDVGVALLWRHWANGQEPRAPPLRAEWDLQLDLFLCKECASAGRLGEAFPLSE